MQEDRSSNPPVVTGICGFNKSPSRHHRSLNFGSKVKYLTSIYFVLKLFQERFLFFSSYLTHHKKLSFPLRISLVNVTKSAGNCGFGHIY